MQVKAQPCGRLARLEAENVGSMQAGHMRQGSAEGMTSSSAAEGFCGVGVAAVKVGDDVLHGSH